MSTEVSSRPVVLANRDLLGTYSKSIEDVLRLEPEQIDIATAVLIISEQWSDMVNSNRYLEQLDEMATEILERMKRNKIGKDHRAVNIINQYLFEELGFISVKDATKPEDLFLHSVLDNRRGYCLSLSVLYLAVGERVGLDLHGVVVPEHFFVRYDNGRVKFNIETTSGGAVSDDDHYIERFNIPENEYDSVYLKSLNKRQTLGCFFNNLGNIYSETGDFDTALQALERAALINPSLAESRANYGNILLKKGRIDDAIYEYRASISLNGNNSTGHNNLGNAYFEKGWYNDAINEYKVSIAQDSNFAEGYKNLSNVYIKTRDYDSAKKYLFRALELNPADSEVFVRIGDCIFNSGDYQESISWFEKALKHDSQSCEAYFGLGMCYNKTGDTNQEIHAFQKALKIKPDMYEALSNLGGAHFSRGDYDKAIEMFNKSLALNTKDWKVYYNLGAAYSNTSYFDDAVDAYLKALTFKNAEKADIHHQLSYAYYNLGIYELAKKHIDKAADMGFEVNEDLSKAIERNF
jgi:tetratricopeptide (TPR) repeat protein